MYTFDDRYFGYKVTFNGLLGADEIAAWREEVEERLRDQSEPFAMLIDLQNMTPFRATMHALEPLSADAEEEFHRTMETLRRHGMKRCAVVVDNRAIRSHFHTVSRKAGRSKWERYIDVSSSTNWMRIAMDWLTRGVDPRAKN